MWYGLKGDDMIVSIHKASVLLKALAKYYPESVSLDTLSKETGISKSTCVQMLNTLIHDALAERTKYSMYCLGAGCFHLTRSGRFDKKRMDICRPILYWLRDKTGETALISQIRSSEKYTVDYAIGNYRLHNSGDDIILDDIYRTATGRMIVAHLPDDDLYSLVERHGLPDGTNWKAFDNMASFKKALTKLRESPWIMVDSELVGYAAPIFCGNTVFGAIGLAVPKASITEEKEAENVKYLLRAAKEITRRLNF